MFKKLQLLFACILFSFLFFSCQTTSNLTKANDWETIAPGIEILTQKVPEEKSSWTCVKIDLNNKNIDLFIYPDSSATKAVSLKKLSKDKNLIAAINSTPFEKDNSLLGITKINGNIITNGEEKYSALCFYNINDKLYARIISNQTEENLLTANSAIGGFFTILKNNEVIYYNNIKRSRSGCGISPQGNLIYLFAATPDFSLTDKAGFTYEECANILKELGCSDALMFDGGHSTGLTVQGKNIQTPLFQRKIPAALGIILK